MYNYVCMYVPMYVHVCIFVWMYGRTHASLLSVQQGSVTISRLLQGWARYSYDAFALVLGKKTGLNQQDMNDQDCLIEKERRSRRKRAEVEIEQKLT